MLSPLATIATAVALAAGAAIVFLSVRLRRVLVARAELERRFAASRASEQQLRHVADVMPALISYVGSDWRYRFVNRLYGPGSDVRWRRWSARRPTKCWERR